MTAVGKSLDVAQHEAGIAPPSAAEFTDRDALVAYKDWGTAVGTYWSYCQVVSLGALGAAAKLGEGTPTGLGRAIFVGGFATFAIGNLTALLKRQAVFNAIAEGMRPRADAITPPEYQAIFRKASSHPTRHVAAFHIVISFLVAGAIVHVMQ